MKTLILVLSYLVLLPITLLSQAPPIQWDMAYGGNNSERFSFIKQTKDGGYINGGWSQSNISGCKSQDDWDITNSTSDYWILKSDANGTKQWDKRFGGTDMETFHTLQQTSDNGYILGGFSASAVSGDVTHASPGGSDYWVIKIDSLGNTQWDARFGGSKDDILYSVIQTSDGGYLLAGFSESDISGDKTQANQGGKDYWIVKTDAWGIKQWDQSFGGSDDDFAYCVEQTVDGGYIVGGTSASGLSGDHSEANRGPAGTMDYWVIKTDALGNKQWDKRFGTKDNDLCVVSRQTSDGGYILGGYSAGSLNGDRSEITRGAFDYWLVKIDDLGSKQWDHVYGGSSLDYLFSLQITADDGFVLGGTSYSDISGEKTEAARGNEDYWIIKTDDMGTIQWDKTMGGIDSDWLTDVYQTTDGYYICGGWSSSDVSGEKTQPLIGSSDFWVVKLGQPTPLPVELISFDATAKTNFIQLKWSTVSENKNSGFELQRSTNATDFEKLSFIKGHGNSTCINNYFYDDKNVERGIMYYYRLKQIDFDGTEKFSSIVAAKIRDNNSVDLIVEGNPVQTSTTISYFLTSETPVQLILRNIAGQKIQILKNETETCGEHFFKIDKNMMSLNSGIYFVTLITNTKTITRKLVIE